MWFLPAPKMTGQTKSLKAIKPKSNNLNDLDFEYLKGNDETCYCKTCIHEVWPFCNKKIYPNEINLGNVGVLLLV